MSHRTLRRVVVRLLHDPTLVARVAADPDGALAGLDLTAAERGWLAAVPPNAWRTDPDRPRRVLAALRDEYPASLALSPAQVDGFFASAAFHRAVDERGSLAIAFGDHLIDAADPRLDAVARLERAMASVRRAPRHPQPSPTGRLRLSPTARVVRVLAGTSDLLVTLRAGRPPFALGAGEEALLVEREPSTGEVRVECLEPALASLLERGQAPIDRQELVDAARGLGADEDDASAVVDALIADGVLI